MTRGFSQNESSAWNGTGFIKIAFAQDFDCTVAGGYAATLSYDVWTFEKVESPPA